MKQEYTSANTSINAITSIYNKVTFPKGTEILDYGGGRYDTNANHLKPSGVLLKVYDPYNRTPKHNEAVLRHFKSGAEVIVCANVLNVIKEDEVILNVLRHINMLLKGTAYIQIYEGDKTGNSKQTSKGYQRNQKTAEYIKLLDNVFDSSIIKRKGNILIVSKETV
jgi:hypothetical protein